MSWFYTPTVSWIQCDYDLIHTELMKCAYKTHSDLNRKPTVQKNNTNAQTQEDWESVTSDKP